MYRVRTGSNQYRKTRGRHCEVEFSVLGAFQVILQIQMFEAYTVTKDFCLTWFELIRTIASSTTVPSSLRGSIRGRQLPTSLLDGSQTAL